GDASQYAAKPDGKARNQALRPPGFVVRPPLFRGAPTDFRGARGFFNPAAPPTMACFQRLPPERDGSKDLARSLLLGLACSGSNFLTRRTAPRRSSSPAGSSARGWTSSVGRASASWPLAAR